jgi:hypothetical protein
MRWAEAAARKSFAQDYAMRTVLLHRAFVAKPDSGDICPLEPIALRVMTSSVWSTRSASGFRHSRSDGVTLGASHLRETRYAL